MLESSDGEKGESTQEKRRYAESKYGGAELNIVISEALMR